MREWTIGDKFTLEFEVVKIRRHSHAEWEVDATTTCEEDMSFFSQSQMMHAKLIQPATPEPEKLDVTQPMRRKGTENERLHYLHENPLGQIYCTDASGTVVPSP